MVITSQEYKEEQAQPLRERSYVYVYIGLINLIAKAAATVTEGLTAYSSVDYAFRSTDHNETAQYATLEEQFTKVDGSNAFLPRNAYSYDDRQGIVVAALNQKVTITFGSSVNIDIKGFTIDFGEQYPTEFTITNGSDSYTYTKTDDDMFSCEDQFENCRYIEIIPVSMLGNNQRLRIRSMEFGVGLSFTNDQIISTQRRNSVSHVSEALPLKAFDFTIDNLSRRFSQDNPKSFSNYIQQGQMVEYKYGREVPDYQGELYTYEIPGGKTYIKTWSSTDLQAKFSTVGKLDLLDTEYYKGKMRTYDSGTLYDAAEEVLIDAGFSDDEYVIDNYLKRISLTNPLPIATHKACLQMIASASRSVLYEDREGRITIMGSFIPGGSDLDDYYLTDIYQFDTEVLDRDVNIYTYASLEKGFTRVDNTMRFRPRSGGVLGLVSDIVKECAIELIYDFAWSCYSVELTFAEIMPYDVHVTFGYIDQYGDAHFIAEVSTYDVKPVTKFTGEFINFNYVAIEVSNWDIFGEHDDFLVDEFDNYIVHNDGEDNIIKLRDEVSNRIHIKKIKFTKESDYTIGNIDLKELPTATSVDLVKQINITKYAFDYSYEPVGRKQLISTEVHAANEVDSEGNPYDGHNIIKLSAPAANYCLLWDDGTEEWSESKNYAVNDYSRYNGIKYKALQAGQNHKPTGSTTSNSYWSYVAMDATVSAYGAYYVDAYVPTSHNQKILVYGNQATVRKETISKNLNDMGQVINLNNQLCCMYGFELDDYYKKLMAYLVDYYSTNTEYTISYRGEPALDCDDLVYLENQFVDNNLCRIEEEEISTAVGMSLSNSMKLRRVSYDIK